MENLTEKLSYYQGKICYLTVCLDIVFYFENSLFEHAQEVIAFYHKVLEVIGSHLTYSQNDNMGKARKITSKALESVPFWFENPEIAMRPILMFELESGSSANSVSDCAFSLLDNETLGSNLSQIGDGHLRVMLPINTIEKSVTPLIELAKSLANLVKYSSGHAGFSVNRQTPGGGDYAGEAHRQCYFLSQRYLGIDFDDGIGTSQYVYQGIKCATWLTFINPHHIECLGGQEKIIETLGPECPVHTLNHGLMVQAGPRPELGDVNRQQTLPYYHRVGRLLKPIRLQQHSQFLETPTGEDVTMQWLARFDE